jgi:polyferredoxin
MGSEKETMQININKTTHLYSIKGDKIQDAYVFLFHNTSKKEHTYYFSIDNPLITIQRPQKAFSLKAGKKLKKIVALSINKSEINNLRKKYPNGIIDINIKTYATDDKTIFANRKNIFAFPKK